MGNGAEEDAPEGAAGRLVKMVNISLEETADGNLQCRIVSRDLRVIEALAAAYALLSSSADLDPDPEIAVARDRVLAIMQRGGTSPN